MIPYSAAIRIRNQRSRSTQRWIIPFWLAGLLLLPVALLLLPLVGLVCLIARINHDGITVMLVEQNVVQSLALAHRAYVLENGRVVMTGEADALARDPALGKAYLGM